MVTGEVTREVVDVDKDTGLILASFSSVPIGMTISTTYTSVHSRNRDEGSRGTVATVDDVDLGTADVELCTAVGARNVERNLWGQCEPPAIRCTQSYAPVRHE